jgi:nicotinate-nucleotide adenylyltransferase
MKIGLFFGSFNPIHLGHLSIAQYILNETDIQKIKFIVSPHNPLKEKDSLMDAELRLDMLRLSIADNVHFEVSDIEFTLPTPSYTFQTLEALKAQPSKHSIIMGTDALERLGEWKELDKILSFPIIVYKRSETFINPFPGHPNITVLDSPILDISATQIRDLMKERKNIKYLVRDEVINLLKLY